MNNTPAHLFLNAAMGLCLSSFMVPAQALIANGLPANGGSTAELVLVIFDPVKEVSYTKDLGIYAAPFNAANDNSKNLFVQAQQDAGYQKFLSPLNSDPNFKEFLSVSTDVSKQQWGIYATGEGDEFFGPGSTNFFTTLNSTWSGGTNPSWSKLTGIPWFTFQELARNFTNFLRDLNNGIEPTTGVGFGNSFNSHQKEGLTFGVDEIDPAELLLLNGSSFDRKGVSPYFPRVEQGYLPGSETVFIGGLFPNTMNPVGSSSWFYYMTPSADLSGSSLALVDEFDNLGHDGYWGLAVDTNGDYILSFTMQSSLTAASTAQGLARRNRTDFSALYGGVRSVLNPANEFIGWIPNGNVVSAVPEPSTYGLFGLGLAALAWRSRRRSA